MRVKDYVSPLAAIVIIALMVFCILVTINDRCPTPEPGITLDQWGQPPMTEEQLCVATILQWDAERCADF